MYLLPSLVRFLYCKKEVGHFAAIFQPSLLNACLVSLLYIYRLVGDNIDHEIRARVQTKDRSNSQYAIKDSVINPLLDNSKAQKSLDQLQLMDLLPTPEVQARLKKTWAIIVS